MSDVALRDLYTRGKYRDVILPMTVLRRLDAVLEPSKQKVLTEKQMLDDAEITDQDDALQLAAGHTFYNTSSFTLRDVSARTSQKSTRADFDTYLDGFSPNVQQILEKFEFRHELNRLTESNTLGALISKFLSPDINLSPYPLVGLFTTTIKGKPMVVEYGPDPNLRDTERIPLTEDGGIEEFIKREVLPHVADAWYMPFDVKVGYEINFNQHFYKTKPMRQLEEITADIMALEKECNQLLARMS